MNHALRATGIHKRYAGAGRSAVCGVDLEVEDGEIVALVGPSGCGKTTLLRLVAGLEALDQGAIEIGGQEVARDRQCVPTEKRGIALVFQEHALFPHLDVRRNVAFGPRHAGRADAEAHADAMLRLVGLGDLAERAPHELSGGEQQRVAVARALAVDPTLMLLDEPFNSLDAAHRVAVRREIRTVLKQTRTSALLVTHDQEEALSMADRVAVMQAGRIVQTGTPEDVYARPATAFVARFVSGATVIEVEASGAVAASPLGRLSLLQNAQGPVSAVVRPDQVGIVSEGGVEAVVTGCEYRGASTILTVQAGGLAVRLRTEPDEAHAEGASVRIAVREPVCCCSA